MLVDSSGASARHFDNVTIPGMRDRLEKYKVLDGPRKLFNNAVVMGLRFKSIAHGLLRSHVIDDRGVRRLSPPSCLVMPDQGCNLFPVRQAARYGVVAVVCVNDAKVAANKQVHIPASRTGTRSVLIFDGSCRDGNKRATASNTGRSYRHRMEWTPIGHHNLDSVDVVMNLDNNGMSFGEPVSDCAVGPVGKNHQLAHPQDVERNLSSPLPACFRRPDGTVNPRNTWGLQLPRQVLGRAHQVDE